MRPAVIRAFLDGPALQGPPTDQRREAWLAGLDEQTAPALARCELPPLVEAQDEAWRAMAYERVSLVLGPPGTGKTYTVAWMVVGYMAACAQRGFPCRVLVTAHTRNAIANLLESINKCQRTLETRFAVGFLGTPPDTGLSQGVASVGFEVLAKFLEDQQVVVGATSWALFRALEGGKHGGEAGLTDEVFDLSCLDEASQVRVSQGLMALMALQDDGRLIVAGDDRQLAPIGEEASWAPEGAPIKGSFYTFLAASEVPEHPLTVTFRLNRPLAEPPGSFFYDDNFHAAPSAAERRLVLSPNWRDDLPQWLQAALDPEFPICILIHDGPPRATRNPLEVQLISDLVGALAHRIRNDAGERYDEEELWQEGLAIVSPHRAQNAALRAHLASAGLPSAPVVETVDRIQGRERDAVVFGYTVSDPEFAVIEGAFLFARERFNVAITRARTKLIVVLSRRILHLAHAEDAVSEAAHFLREFVYGSDHAGSFAYRSGSSSAQVEVRLRRFDSRVPLPRISNVVEPPAAPPDFTPWLQEVLDCVRRVAAANESWGTASNYVVKQQLAASTDLYDESMSLFRLGWIKIDFRDGRRGLFWNLRPFDEPLPPFECTRELVRRNIRAVIDEVRGGRSQALYEGWRDRGVRDRFVWFDSTGADQLMPILRALADEGHIRLEDAVDSKGRTYHLVGHPPEAAASLPPGPATELQEDDWRTLNALEDLEARRINLGVVEAWCGERELRLRLIDEGLPTTRRALACRLDALEEHGFILQREGRIRSRMAELARELRYVKQRFREGDANRRPYLVRSMKVIVRPRDKPVRDRPLSSLVKKLKAKSQGESIRLEVLDAFEHAMRLAFQHPQPQLSGFQERGAEVVLDAWFGRSKDKGFVVTADTGSGKTEVAVLPLLVGAAVDHLVGIFGTRVVLVYPRIRLGVNQAQRLARYAAAMNSALGATVLTVGFQSGDVPRSWERYRRWLLKAPDDQDQLWRPEGDGSWEFPFFACPSCDHRLILDEGSNSTVPDRLRCTSPECGWLFEGWVGTKEGLWTRPPSLFVTITESLHRWMQDPACGRLFGDLPGFDAPRAVVADEIHLYALVAGAQVGYALRRLMARSTLNSNGSTPIAIGMSATLGQPAEVWADLLGWAADDIRHVEPKPEERLENPAGREYFYFVQPEVESRGKEIAGASTTIQALMCLAHGMRRRTGDEGGFRAIAFLDSIDKVKRLCTDFYDAESSQNLARLRTVVFGAEPHDPQVLRNECCGHPESCDRFRDGECWYFAANDSRQVGAAGHLPVGQRLAVQPWPIYSGTKGNAERQIDRSDVVFATSSLEVGFDDPDMALVYQHYAPVNLASFVQRKGRAGRGSGDRPVTGVTLSLYSPRDTYYFRAPERMLEAHDHRVPLNTNNWFVRRGQLLSWVIDLAARHHAKTGWTPAVELPPPLAELVQESSHLVTGKGAGADDDLDVLLRWKSASQVASRTSISKWRELMDEVPTRLFDSINLPILTVHPYDYSDPRDEDVALALFETMPGRMTRRWGATTVHWIPYQGKEAPMYEVGPTRYRSFPLARGLGGSRALTLLPDDVREALGDRLEPAVLRPTFVKPVVAGTFDRSEWKANWTWSTEGDHVLWEPENATGVPISHKSQGIAQTVLAVHRTADPVSTEVPVLEGWACGQLLQYQWGHGGRAGTGLWVTQAAWCSDVELILEDVERTRVHRRQVFTDPRTGVPRLHGFGMVPEGIQIALDSQRLDAFVAGEMQEFAKDNERKKWHMGQFLRYLVMSRVSRVGLNRFQARQLSDLMISAAADPDLVNELFRSLSSWDSARFLDALHAAWQTHLAEWPLLTERRWERLDSAVRAPGIGEALGEVMRTVSNPDSQAGYVRSVVLNGILTRLKQSFVLHGMGDERQVVGHAQLPVMFRENPSDLLTVCERGSGGDGTTRAFVAAADEAFGEWMRVGVVHCPNALSDELVATAAAMRDRHASWLSREPRDPVWVCELLEELGLPGEAERGAVPVLLNVLYGDIEYDGCRVSNLDLYLEARTIEARALSLLGRRPLTWELVGHVVRQAREGLPEKEAWARLYQMYAGLEHVPLEGTLSPSRRVADQVHRIATPLCVDGCPACLHARNDQMDDGMAEVLASRTMLERYWAFVRRG